MFEPDLSREMSLSSERIETPGLYRTRAKRWVDLVLALVMLPALMPIIAMLWVLVRSEGGPGFFGHKRVGRDGQTFRCWKIRTMVPDAEAVLNRHLEENPAARREWADTFKLTHDPRITRLGNFLRRSSLDELPQIWNVIKGEMSFVGPRPVTRVELEKYSGYEWSYLSTRPGITGPWQVSGRNDLEYYERVQLDVAYSSDHNFIGDMKIMAATAGAVLNATGR